MPVRRAVFWVYVLVAAPAIYARIIHQITNIHNYVTPPSSPWPYIDESLLRADGSQAAAFLFVLLGLYLVGMMAIDQTDLRLVRRYLLVVLGVIATLATIALGDELMDAASRGTIRFLVDGENVLILLMAPALWICAYRTWLWPGGADDRPPESEPESEPESG